MRTPFRLGVLTLCMLAAAATLAQSPDIKIKRSRDLEDLPPMRRPVPPTLDQRTPIGEQGRRQPPRREEEQPPPRREEARPQPRREEEQPPRRREAVRPPVDKEGRGTEPIVTVVDKGPRDSDSVGTAFAIDNSGNWVTAGHVVDGCKMIYIYVKGDWLPVTVLGTHEVADVAAIRARDAGPPMQVATDDLKLNQDGYQIGFPQFKPGETRVRLIGRVRVARSQRGGQMEVAYSWAEVERRPDFQGTLGGISGGPIVDSRGFVVGVNILESSRRGRVTTSAPTSILQVLKQARVAPETVKPVETTPENFDTRADEARAAFSVARVFCAFTRDAQPPRVRR